MLTERTTTLFVSIFYFQKCQTRDYTTIWAELAIIFCRGDHVGRPFTQIRFTSISHVPGGLATREPLQNII